MDWKEVKERERIIVQLRKWEIRNETKCRIKNSKNQQNVSQVSKKNFLFSKILIFIMWGFILTWDITSHP